MSERSKRRMDTAAQLVHGDRPDPATEAFLAHRNLLFTVAYEMLGSAADAEDVLQETWLRWARRGRGRRVGRQRLDGDAAGAGDARADRAGGVRAARGVRPGGGR